MSNVNRKRLRITAAAAMGAIAVAGTTLAMSGAGIAQASATRQAAVTAKGMQTMPAGTASAYQFSSLDNASDLTFNQLLGVNNEGVIAGYFGSGAQGHPNKGFLLLPQYGQGNYVNENFPGSVQTQVTGLNDNGDTVGFRSSMNNASQVNDNHGFWAKNGAFHTVDFPTGDNANPRVDQLLGINDNDVAVGFYTNGQGNNRGYTYSVSTRTFTRVQVPGYPTGVAGPSLTAAAINDNGDVAGFYVDRNGTTDAFLAVHHGGFSTLDYPGATATQAFGVNDHDEVVGAYTVGSGSSATMHGFTWTPDGGFVSVDDPNGMGTTTVNGVNNAGDLVGFYVDGAGNTDGFLARPPRKVKAHLTLMAMPQGSATLGRDGSNDVTAAVNVLGLTPGSSHAAELVSGNGGIVALFGMLTANGVGQAQATLDSGFTGSVAGLRLVLLNGTAANPVSLERIAKTRRLTTRNATYQLIPVEVTPSGSGFGSLDGKATITYSPIAQTITVTLTASGVTPGMHAAHIHIGSCQSQGPVQYMLMDFTANGQGWINHETRVVTGVTTPLPSTGWYLNLHQGNSNNILSGGNPTINFRPLLCANI
jgi:hypothetical protein